VAERQLPKLYVVGSIPIARSKFPLAAVWWASSYGSPVDPGTDIHFGRGSPVDPGTDSDSGPDRPFMKAAGAGL
jgi:hypothetical protein